MRLPHVQDHALHLPCLQDFRVKSPALETALQPGVIAKLVAAHELLILNLYPFLQRYMEPHQQHVTHILAWSAQCVHSLVPPDAVHSLHGQWVGR
eukprot:gene17829-biopygen8335